MLVVIKVEITTIAILIKLFAIKMVASNRSGFDKRSITRRDALLCNSFNFPLSDGLNEKNATSDPETRAEQMRSIIIEIIPTITPGVRGFNCMVLIIAGIDKNGSESKRQTNFVYNLERKVISFT